MANRQQRDPGQIRRFDATAQIGGVPSFAVDTGQAFDALARVAGGLSAKLGRLADQAVIREGEMAGLNAGAQSGASYLKMQAAEAAAAAKAGRMTPEAESVITAAALRHGVNPAFLKRVAMIESGGNAGAVSSTGARGPFQFVSGTARQYGLDDPTDWAKSADAAARLTADNARLLRKQLGREPTLGELYLAHQQGAGGAAALLYNPDRSAAEAVGERAVSVNGGATGISAGAFARMWTRKFADLDGGGSDAPPATQTIVPVLPTTPLALRRDGTLYGEAYDQSARNAYAWRLQSGLSTSMQAAYEENRDDPVALSGALAKVHDEFAADPNLADPQTREAFDRRFVERSQAYMIDARAAAERKMRAEETAAASEGIAAQRLDIERQAVALGASPQGDAIMAREVERAGRAIDAAVATGSLSPAQGAKAKADLAETAATGRVRGVYDALATTEEKTAFAEALLADWTAGKGPLAKLPYDTVRALSQTLWNDARAEDNRRKAENRAEAARLEDLVRDDVASVASTGKGLDPKESGLDPARVQDLLGPAAFERWRADRATASRSWGAVNGMETQTPEEIAARLATLQPVAGAPGFADNAKIFDFASRRAREILDARAKDPAAAAEASFPAVAALAETASADNPDSMQALVAARLQAQGALGVDELARDPLTHKEAVALARAVTAEADPSKQARAMKELAGQVQTVYGPHGEAVMRQVLGVTGIDRQTAAYGAQIFRRLNDGRAPAAAAQREGGVLAETGEAGRAMTAAGKADAYPLPNYKQSQMLLMHPELAPQFDEKFGPGAAQRLIGQRRQPLIFQEDGGTTTLEPGGEESWQPGKAAK